MDGPSSRYGAVPLVAAVLVPLLVGELAALKLSRTELDVEPAGAATRLYPCFSVYQIDLNETKLFTHIGSPESADCAYTFEAPDEASLELEVGNIAAPATGGAAYGYGYSYSYACGPQTIRIFDFRPDGALVVAATWCGWPVQGAALRARSSRNLAVVTSTVALGSFDLRVSAAPLPDDGNVTDLVPVSELEPPPPPSTAASTSGDTDSPQAEQEQPSATPTAAAVVGVESDTTNTGTTTTTTSTTTAEASSEHESPLATTVVPPRVPSAIPLDGSTNKEAPEQSTPPTTAATVAETGEDPTQPPPPLRSAASAL